MGFKSLIARRRPSKDHEPEEGDAVSLAAAQDEEAALEENGRDIDLAAARAGRDHVPRMDGPVPDPRQEWLGQFENGQDWVGESTLPEHERTQSAPKSKPKIWDLESTPQPEAAQTQPAPVSNPAPPVSQPPARMTRPLSRPMAPMTRPQADEEASSLAQCAAEALTQMPQSEPRPASDRVKTRLIGFHADAPEQDVLAMEPAQAANAVPMFPIGWLIVVEGPGRGASFTLTAGLSTVGRDSDQTVSLDFGDTAISRERHVAIAYDEEENRAYVGHGGKSNIVRHNDKPLLTTEEFQDGDTIKIGKTVLRFVAFCDDEFAWTSAEQTEAPHD